MSDRKQSEALSTLNNLLEDEREARASQPTSGLGESTDDGSDGVVTSAPKAAVGSLLTDLLNEAKKEVAREREDLERQLNDKAEEERLAKQREEARKREQLQQQLIEETRRRNEALTRKEKEEAEARAAAAPKPEVEKPVSAAVPVQAAPAKKFPIALVASLVAVILGGGGFGAYAYATQPPGFAVPEINPRVQVAVTEVRAELAKQKAAADAAKAKAEAEALAAKLEEAAKSNAALAKDAEEARKKADAAAKAAKEAEEEAKPKPKATGRRTGKKPGGLGIKKVF